MAFQILVENDCHLCDYTVFHLNGIQTPGAEAVSGTDNVKSKYATGSGRQKLFQVREQLNCLTTETMTLPGLNIWH